MKVVLVHQHFRCPAHGGGIRTWHIARALAALGHEVDVVTAHAAAQTRRVVLAETAGRVRVHYLPVAYRQQMDSSARTGAFVRFLLLALKETYRMRGVDLLYTVTTPLTVPLVGWCMQRCRHVPYVVEIGDLWPDVPIALGLIRTHVLRVALRKLEKTVYRSAVLLIPYAPDMVPVVARRAPNVPWVVVPNVADCSFFTAGFHASVKPDLPALGLTGAFVVGYFGAAGYANQLANLLDAARVCQTRVPEVRFLIAAEGSEWPALRARAQGLANVVVHAYTDKAGVRALMRQTDACYVSFRPEPVLATGCPNKFFDALAAGKLCVVNFGGWLRDLVERHGCGFYADPLRPEAFADQLRTFVDDTDLLTAYQQRARGLAEKSFDVAVLMNRLTKALAPWLGQAGL